MQGIGTVARPLGSRRTTGVALLAATLAALVVAALAGMQGDAAQRAPSGTYGELPLSFVPNAGQTDGRVRFTAQGAGFAFHFTPHKAVLSFTKGSRGVALHLTPLGANPAARLEAGERRAGKVNYLTGGERHVNLPTYGELTYRDLWPGIDMVFRGSGGALKYEFHVQPGADPSRIRLAYRGSDSLTVGAAGNLLIGTPLGTLRDSRPRSYQVVRGERTRVASRYTATRAAYGFALGSYDPARPLVIDPGLTYSTFLGGSVNDQGNGIAVDASGNAFVTGQADSATFPTTAGAFDTTFNAQTEAFVTRLNAAGTAMTYSTYLGGTGDDIGRAIAVDAFGSAYVTGTAQTGFPTTAGALDTTISGSDAFVTKLNSSGSALLYSTYLGSGSSDNGQGIAVDANGQAYVAGDTISTTFPTTAGAFDTTANGGGSNFDGFVSKLNSTGSGLVFSTYLGGATGLDTASSIALGTGLTVHVAGRTASTDFPATTGAFDTIFNGGPQDGFEAKLNAAGSGLDYATYLGGTGDELFANVAVDPAGNAYVGGGTSSADYPTTSHAFDRLKDSGTDVFVTKLNTTGTAPVYSTFIGGSGSDIAADIAVDANGNAFLTGATTSSAFPVSSDAFDATHNGVGDVFVSRLNAAGAALTHSTFLGTNSSETGRAIAVDTSANAFVTGNTPNAAFPVTAGTVDTTHNGSEDVFVAKVNTAPTATPGYVRPKGASPLRVSLVPAFITCTSPDEVHGPPDLPGGTNPDGSCNPPVQTSNVATVGAPDSNGKPVNSEGFVRLKVVTGNPATAVDEADVEMTASITDVRNKSDLTDYVGGLRVDLDLRMTDRFNGATHVDTGTMQNIFLRMKLTCVATPAGPDIGATCGANTSADAITPGVAREGVRSVWEVGQVQVSDGGPDGDVDTTPNSIFVRQGILIP